MSLDAGEEDIARLEAELQRLHASLESQQRETETLSLQNSDLVKQIEDLENDIHQRGTNAERWRQRFLTEKKAHEETKTQVHSLQNAVKSRDDSNRELAAQKVSVVQELGTVKEQVRELNAELYDMSQANGLLEGKCRALVEENEVLEQEIELLHAQEQQIGTTREITRRYSDPEPVRSLSEELAGSSDSDGSGQTLFDTLDDSEHVDLDEKLDRLRGELGWENMQWLTPDEMASMAGAFKKIWTDVAGVEIRNENMSAAEVLVAALAKQQLLIDKLLQSSDAATNILDVENTQAITTKSELDTKVRDATADSRLPLPATEKQTDDTTTTATDHPGQGIMKVYSIVANRLPFLRYIAYLVPKQILESYAEDDIAVKVTILLLFFFALALSVALAVGTGLGYWVATTSTAFSWCSVNHVSFARAMARRRLPWWIGSRIPFVEGIMFRLEGWAANRYGYNRILVS
ncbi:hypothetical protein V1509DRAFT_658971 [Lipomyces kononenkoae]